MPHGQIDFNPSFDYQAFCERISMANLREVIKAEVVQLLTEAERSELGASLKTFLDNELDKLEASLKSYIDAELAKLSAPSQKQTNSGQ